jgi:hypothetical protein
MRPTPFCPKCGASPTRLTTHQKVAGDGHRQITLTVHTYICEGCEWVWEELSLNSPVYTPAQVAKHIKKTGDRVVLGEEER